MTILFWLFTLIYKVYERVILQILSEKSILPLSESIVIEIEALTFIWLLRFYIDMGI